MKLSNMFKNASSVAGALIITGATIIALIFRVQLEAMAVIL